MRRVQRKRPIDYILPFLVILGLGVIGVLGYQIWSNFAKQGQADVYFYVAEGNARVLPFGQTNWDMAYSGTKLLLGDSLKSSSIGRMVMQFFNGTLIRMGADTAVTLTDVTKIFDTEKISVNLDNGMVWVHGHKSDGVRQATYEVRTPHALVKATGTVFEVENGSVETIRVFDGQVAVDVMVKTDGKDRVADTVQVGVGQEMNLDEATIRAFEQSSSPSVLQAVSDSFKATDWYLWNMKEDANPTDFAAKFQAGGYSDESRTSQTQMPVGSQQTSTQQISTTQELGSDIVDTSSAGSGAPVILVPGTSASTTDKNAMLLSGTVPKGTSKVMIVSNTPDGKTDSYTLGKFKLGDTTWSYNVSEKLGNFLPGDNVYRVYAIDGSGKKSDSAEVTITYNKAKVTITDALSAPVVATFNGTTVSTVTTGVVKVEGTIKGADKLVVNDYTLSKFVSGSTSWVYFANESGGNLKPGVNQYEVYGVAPDGTKSAKVTFTITYNKAATSTPTGTQQTTSTTQQPVATQQTQTTIPAYGF